MLQYEINEFGKRLGLPGLETDENDRVGLHLEGLGTLSLELNRSDRGEEVLLVLARPVAPSDVVKYESLLGRVNLRTNLPVPLAAGFFRDQLVLSARFASEDVTAVALENALRLMLDEIARA